MGLGGCWGTWGVPGVMEEVGVGVRGRVTGRRRWKRGEGRRLRIGNTQHVFGWGLYVM